MDITQGLTEVTFAALFVGFFIYSLKQSETRETRLHDILKESQDVNIKAIAQLEILEQNQRAIQEGIKLIESKL